MNQTSDLCLNPSLCSRISDAWLTDTLQTLKVPVKNSIATSRMLRYPTGMSGCLIPADVEHLYIFRDLAHLTYAT